MKPPRWSVSSARCTAKTCIRQSTPHASSRTRLSSRRRRLRRILHPGRPNRVGAETQPAKAQANDLRQRLHLCGVVAALVADRAALPRRAVIYVRGWLAIRRTRPLLFPSWRLTVFLIGLATLWLALASPLDGFADALLSAHMVQHLLLMSAVPPLVLLGLPVVPHPARTSAALRPDRSQVRSSAPGRSWRSGAF